MSWDNTQRKLPHCERGNTCESYRLHSSTSLSLAVWGRLTAQWQHLALCFPFVKIWLHWITITTSTSCPLRSPPCPPLLPSFPASLYPFPTPSPIPPAGSSLNDTLSICLIISPPATPPWPSRGSTFCSWGGAEGPEALQLDFWLLTSKAALSVILSALHCQVQNFGLQWDYRTISSKCKCVSRRKVY